MIATVLAALAAASTDGHVELRSGDLRAVAAQNDAYGDLHRAGYNGLSELHHGQGATLFVPLHAGLNFEHIFSGDSASYAWDIFEPRQAPMALRRRGRRIELLQERTAHWPLRTRITFAVAGRDAIDMTVEATPLEDAWRKHGTIGLFFASYIDAPEDRAIHFIGRSRHDAAPRWISHVPPAHGQAANHRPAGSRWDPPLDPAIPLTLVSGLSEYEYHHPFYYGVSHGKVFVMMFDRPTSDGEIRFAQSPDGGGKGPPANPAWDFIYLRRRYRVGQPFRFRARVVYRDFKDAEDVVRAYEAWSGRRVARP